MKTIVIALAKNVTPASIALSPDNLSIARTASAPMYSTSDSHVSLCPTRSRAVCVLSRNFGIAAGLTSRSRLMK